MKSSTVLVVTGAVVASLVALAVFWPKTDALVVYCATDQEHADPIIQAFSAATGIPVQPEFDTEANKTVGLVQRLTTEFQDGTPNADVFWNNEIIHTLNLASMGALTPYVSPSAADIPDAFKAQDGLWTGFAGRARILLVNTQAIPDESKWPRSMRALTDEAWNGKGAIARPLTGTTLTHATTLYQVLGEGPARQWFQALFTNDVSFPSGNGPVASTVAGGQRWFGFTDTDDARKQQLEGRPVAIVYPDQGPGEPGTLLIPNTVAMVKGGRHPDWAKQFIDYVLSHAVEERLAAGDSAHIPLREAVKRPPHVKGPPAFRPMTVDWAAVAKSLPQRLDELQSLWVR